MMRVILREILKKFMLTRQKGDIQVLSESSIAAPKSKVRGPLYGMLHKTTGVTEVHVGVKTFKPKDQGSQ